MMKSSGKLNDNQFESRPGMVMAGGKLDGNELESRPGMLKASGKLNDDQFANRPGTVKAGGKPDGNQLESRPGAGVTSSPTPSSTSSWTFSRQGVVLTPSAPFCLELCAGSGRLTATLRRFGLDAWGRGPQAWEDPA